MLKTFDNFFLGMENFMFREIHVDEKSMGIS